MARGSRSQTETQSVRRFRRSSTPMAWWPWGILFLGSLLLWLFFGLAVVAPSWVEQVTERTARQALEGVDATWATPEVSGQTVVLRGLPPSRQAAAKAEAAVREAKAATWLGDYPPAIYVSGDYDARPAVTAPTPAGLEWAFRLDDGVMTLEGEVPDTATRSAIETAAQAVLDPPRIERIDNRLVVADTKVPDGYASVVQRGIANLSRCDLGVAEFSCDRYSLLCELPESRAAVVRASAEAPLDYGRVGTIQVLANEAVASCEQAMADVLGRSTIRFATASADIDGTSAPVLDAVAAAARDCPGTLRIEGHTDNTGEAAFNDDLSQRRAASVRQALITRGLAARRLVARGYGSRVPVADNATDVGRSRNRRIEIRVVRASD